MKALILQGENASDAMYDSVEKRGKSNLST